MSFNNGRRPPSPREYGGAHAKARAAAAARHHPSDPCTRCGYMLGPMGPNLHYDHDDDGTRYLGFSHARCNVRAGARKGSAASHRRMYEPPPRRGPRKHWCLPGCRCGCGDIESNHICGDDG